MARSRERDADGNLIPQEPAPKKGNRVWRPKGSNNLSGLDPAYTYKWVAKKPDRIGYHLNDGWEFLNGVNPNDVKKETATIYEGQSLTSNIEQHDRVLMRMPLQGKQERADEINAETVKRTSSLKREAEGEAGAPLHGKITTGRSGSVTTID